MKNLSLLFALLITSITAPADDSSVPEFFKQSIPALTIEQTLQAYGKLHGPDSAFEPKVRELIALAVAAQIPCQYCVRAHKHKAAASGATEDQMQEAIAIAGFVRLLSTGLYGAEYDMEKFQKDLDLLAGN